MGLWAMRPVVQRMEFLTPQSHRAPTGPPRPPDPPPPRGPKTDIFWLQGSVRIGPDRFPPEMEPPRFISGKIWQKPTFCVTRRHCCLPTEDIVVFQQRTLLSSNRRHCCLPKEDILLFQQETFFSSNRRHPSLPTKETVASKIPSSVCDHFQRQLV